MTNVQIYTFQDPDEALAAVAAGVDLIGVTPISGHNLPGEVDIATATAILDAVGDRATRVVLSVSDQPESIAELVELVRPDVVHLCGVAGALPPQAVADVRGLIGDVRIMQAVSVGGWDALDDALAYQEVADYLILDTQASNVFGIGASGMTHDWNVSRAIVEQSGIPVILAGGLSPDNVGEAIRAVRPWAVDSLTHTNRPMASGGFVKDLEKVRQFVIAAREATFAL